MARILDSFAVSIQVTKLSHITGGSVSYTIKDDVDTSYTARGFLRIPVEHHTSVQDLVDDARAQICLVEGVTCSSSSSGAGP